MSINAGIHDSSYTSKWTLNERRMLKHLCLQDGMYFSRYFFKEREATRFIVNPHHVVMSQTLQRIIDGEITRLIINVPPRYTKTEMAVILFIARGLAINSKAKFIHATYSADLALDNSNKAKDIVTSDAYQELFDVRVRLDSSAKKKWYTTEGGGVYAVSAGGQITGFGAGTMDEEGFQGAFIIDDPIKPDDAFSETMRNKINNRFMNTFKSRLAVESKTPIIVIMQRIHEEDPTGFLLTGGTGEMWHHLFLPSPIPPGPVKSWYPKEFTHGIPIEYNLAEGPLWNVKHDAESLDVMNRTDPYTTASQYHQSPSPKGGSIFKNEWWKRWEALPRDIQYARVYGDTAEKAEEHNDWTVFQAWVYSRSHGIILVDQYRDKIEIPFLEQALKDFWNKQVQFFSKLGISCTMCKIEEKSSGTGLVQNINTNTNIPIFGIPRNRDKVSRAHDVVPQIASGNVWIPKNASWIFDYTEEFRKFSPLMTHKHDDQIDPTIDAIKDMLMRHEHVPAPGENYTADNNEDLAA